MQTSVTFVEKSQSLVGVLYPLAVMDKLEKSASSSLAGRVQLRTARAVSVVRPARPVLCACEVCLTDEDPLVIRDRATDFESLINPYFSRPAKAEPIKLLYFVVARPYSRKWKTFVRRRSSHCTGRATKFTQVKARLKEQIE